MTMTMNSGTETMNGFEQTFDSTQSPLNQVTGETTSGGKTNYLRRAFYSVFQNGKIIQCVFYSIVSWMMPQIQKRIPSHQILTLRAQHQYGHIISLCVINDYVLDYQTYSQTQLPTYFSKCYTGELTKEGIYVKVDFSHKSIQQNIQGNFLTVDR